MTAESLAKALNGRRSGSVWLAQCPAHDDRRPSLAIRDASGLVLVHCHAGCPQETVIGALRVRGLWPKREPTTHKALGRTDMRRLARERALRRGNEARARHWQRGRKAILDWLKHEAGETSDIERLETTARELWALQRESGAGVIERWHNARKCDRNGADECENWGAQDIEHAATVVALALDIITEAESRDPIYRRSVEVTAA